jgi:hypothetical protein
MDQYVNANSCWLAEVVLRQDFTQKTVPMLGPHKKTPAASRPGFLDDNPDPAAVQDN